MLDTEYIELLKQSLPSSVDLRSDYEEVYNQGTDSSCGAHAITACLDCLYERSTGIKHRFNKDYIWNWSKYNRGISFGVNTGMDFPSAEATLRLQGAKLEFKEDKEVNEIVKGFQLVQTRIYAIETLKEKLAKGIPILYIINVPISFGNGTDWRKHTVTYNKEFTGGLHYVAIVGYDDNCQRFLFENSWGTAWGDGGFFGVPYEDMFSPFFMQGINHIDEFPVVNKPVKDYKMQPAYMLSNDKVAFVDRSDKAILNMLTEAFRSGSYQGLLDKMKEYGISDKHLETLMQWERGVVRGFKISTPELDWSGVILDQL